MKKKPLKLRTKIATSFTVLLALWTILIVVSLSYILSRGARNLVRERGVSLVRALMTESLPLAHYEELFDLSQHLEQKMQTNPDLRYIAVLEAGDNPIWSTFPGGIPKGLLSVAHKDQRSDDVSVQLIRSEGELIYDYEYERAGVIVRMGLSLSPAQALTQQTITYVMWIAVIGFLASLVFAFYISRPIETLSKAVERALHLDHEMDKNESYQETLETSTIARHFHELMDNLEERTKQLDVSRKLAYLGEMAASMAHELNNPLGIIAMNVAFLSKRAVGGEFEAGAVKEVERLGLATKQATFVAHKLLQFSRYSAHDDKEIHRPVNMRVLVEECLDLLVNRIESSGSTIQINISDRLPKILCDKRGIQQVVFNLLTNAIEASADGGEISISASADETWISLQIADQGHGMSEAVAQQAKEPFFTTKKEGTGLGLAISSSIVESYRGQLLIESQAGRGTIVTVRLPRKEGLA